MALKKPAERNGNNNACQYAADGRQDSAPDPRNLQTHKGGSVDSQGTWRHLGYGDDICKGFLGNPAVNLHDLLLNQRDNRVAAPNAEQSDLKESQKKIDQHVLPPFPCSHHRRAKQIIPQLTSTTAALI